MQCNSLVSLLQNVKNNQFNVDYLRRSRCGGSGTNIQACCSNIEMRGHLDSKAAQLLPSRNICGQQSVKRILGGNVTKTDEFPWTVQLWYKNGMKIIETALKLHV